MISEAYFQVERILTELISEKLFRFPFAGLNLTTVDVNISGDGPVPGFHPSSGFLRNECASDSTSIGAHENIKFGLDFHNATHFRMGLCR